MNATVPSATTTRQPLAALGRISLFAQITSAVLSAVGGVVFTMASRHPAKVPAAG